MSPAALLLLVLAICAVSLVTTLLIRSLERLFRRRFRSRRYNQELPTWGMLYRETLAQEYTKGKRLSRAPRALRTARRYQITEIPGVADKRDREPRVSMHAGSSRLQEG